jgi:hypothetical protein
MMIHPCSQHPKREVVVAAIGGLLWSLIGLTLPNWLNATAFATPCRVHNYLLDGSANVGSGTLIDVAPAGDRGLVLSCAHLFSEGTGRVVVEFPGSQTHGALLVDVDHNADLAALEIAKPTASATPINLQLESSTPLRACGFGPGGEFRCAEGQVLGYSDRPGQRSLRMAGAVRSGDSGGGVFDPQGRLCAVVWGESGGVTYASTGRPLASFLNRTLGSRRANAARAAVAGNSACPDGRCPLVQPGLIGAAPGGCWPAAGGGVLRPSPDCGCQSALAAIAARLDGLEQLNAGGSGGVAVAAPSTLGGAARVAAGLATTALGISGPAGWGVLAAATIGGWLVGRRWKKRSRVASSGVPRKAAAGPLPTRNSQLVTPPEATAAAETSFPIERDDREARELLRLSQLEGRDPLQDAVAGRIALDRLDALAESDADPQHASWADRLRRELRERFNEIAPTKFQT